MNFSVLGRRAEKPCVNRLTDPVDHGEGPSWDYRTGRLYFVDLHAGKLFNYDIYKDETNFIELGGDVTTVIPADYDHNLLLICRNRSLFVLPWDGRNKSAELFILTTVAEDKPDSRFNDGKADNMGRLWLGD